MIPIIFVNGIQSATVEQAQSLWSEGTIDRVTMDGSDYFMASDMALTLAYQGILHEDAFVARAGIKKGGGQCGRGWVGVKGSCKRLAKGADRAGAQKSALKEFAQGRRIEKYGNASGNSLSQVLRKHSKNVEAKEGAAIAQGAKTKKAKTSKQSSKKKLGEEVAALGRMVKKPDITPRFVDGGADGDSRLEKARAIKAKARKRRNKSTSDGYSPSQEKRQSLRNSSK